MHRWALLVGLGSLIACGGGKAADAPPPVVATTGALAGQVVEVSGEVTATRGGVARRLEVGASVHDDDAVATGTGGRIAIKLARNDVTWRLGPNMNQVVAQSAAWGAPRASGDVAQISGDRSAAAGRNAEREAADTAASQTAMPTPAAAAAPAAAVAATADFPMDRGDDPVARSRGGKRAGAPKGGAASDDLAALDGDADSFGAAGLGLTGTGSGGGGVGEGTIGLGNVGSLGTGGGGGGGGGGGLATTETKEAPRAMRVTADEQPNAAPPANSAPPPPPPSDTPPPPPPPTPPADGVRETGGKNAKVIAPRMALKPAAPPTVALVAGGLSVSGARTADAIARGLAPVQAGLTLCAVESDEAAARLSVSFSIAADGKPGAATWSGGSAAFKTCASGAVAKLRFAAGTAASSVKTSIVISR